MDIKMVRPSLHLCACMSVKCSHLCRVNAISAATARHTVPTQRESMIAKGWDQVGYDLQTGEELNQRLCLERI